VGLRGSDVSFSFAESAGKPGWIRGSVYTNEPIGNKVIMVADVNGTQIYIVAPNDTQAEIDRPVCIRLDMKNAIFFDAQSGGYIARHDAANRVRKPEVR
jgi:multiple sugar transport system ATP-binding protein